MSLIQLRDSLLHYRDHFISRSIFSDITDNSDQEPLIKRFLSLMELGDASLLRTTYPGHLTGSAFVITEDFSKTLFTLHGKLNRWLQLGGHADGDADISNVARRETLEESGLDDVQFPMGLNSSGQPVIFDLDIHWIPDGKEPGHFHYDVRYLISTRTPERIAISDESKDLKWFTLEHDAYETTFERGMHRLIDKAIAYRDRGRKNGSNDHS